MSFYHKKHNGLQQKYNGLQQERGGYKENLIDENIANKEKLALKSIHGRRCLTKCYPKGSVYLHPVILTGVKNTLINSCAIDPVHSKDPQYNLEHNMIFDDKCRLEDNQIYKPPDELESILLSFYFNPRDFLANIYEINSFDEAIRWTLENDHLPFDTIKRVNNCAWKVFGNKIEELSSRVLEYYFDISRTYWLKDYIKIIQNKFSFDFTSNKNKDISDAFDELYQLFYSKIYTYNFFVNAVKRYIYEYQDKWELINSHYLLLKKFIFEQLIIHIESTLTNTGKNPTNQSE